MTKLTVRMNSKIGDSLNYPQKKKKERMHERKKRKILITVVKS